MERIDNLLRAAHRKGGDNHQPFAIDGSENELRHLLVGVFFGRVLAVAVSALDLQIIDAVHWLRIAQNVVIAPADIAAEEIAEATVFFSEIEHYLGGSENMSGIAKHDRHAVEHGKWAVIINRHELPDGFIGIGGGIERLNGRLAMFGALFRNKGGIIAL